MDTYRIVMNNYLCHYDIRGAKWGVRRFQNEDGTLTELGKQRLRERRERERRNNPDRYFGEGKKTEQNLRKLDARLNDPEYQKYLAKEWEKDDLTQTKKIFDLGQDVIREAKNVEKATRPAPESRKRMDLSHMTDQQLREKINRELLERQYNDIFNKPPPVKVSKGHQLANDILTYGGATLAAGSTALSIALAIKQLKG